VRGTWKEGSFDGDSERYVKEGSGNGTSLSIYRLHKGNLEGAPLLGTSRDISRQALEMESLSPYRGSVRGTWREGSYTEESTRHLIEGSVNGAFLFAQASYRELKGT
jgi:hypothetical protein